MATEPVYLQLGLTELRRRAAQGLEELRSCAVCPRHCGVDRLADHWSFCKIGRHAVVSSAFPHFGEEDCLRGWNGSGTIFFSMCNLKCAFCLLPDTHILTDKGMRSIEDIFLSAEPMIGMQDDQVCRIPDVQTWTHTGQLVPVRKAFRHPFSGQLMNIKPYGLPPIVLTSNHPVFVANSDLEPRKVVAGELTVSDLLLVPRPVIDPIHPVLDTRLILTPFVGTYRRRGLRTTLQVLDEAALRVGARLETSAQAARRLGYHAAYMRALLPRVERGELDARTRAANSLIESGGRLRFKTERGSGIPARITLDEDVAALLGYFCAEGHVRSASNRPNSHTLVFSFGQHEPTRVRRVQRLLKRVFGVEAQVISRRTTTTVEAGRASISLFFTALCGTGARQKRIPDALFVAPDSIMRAFLTAYWEGDGTVQKGLIVANTVSGALAYGLVGLLLRLGIFPYFYATPRRNEQTIEGRKVRQAETLFYVKCSERRWNGSAGVRRARYHATPRAFWVPIRSITRVAYEGFVYNLAVDHPDHSYTANGIGVGNCQNADISQQKVGREASAEDLAHLMIALQDQGCHNINLVTPEHVVPQILEALPPAVERRLHLPIVYNTSAYDSMRSLALLDGIVDIYMPDFKFWDRARSRLYLKAPDYPDVARRTIVEMHRQVGPLHLDASGLATRGVLIRHLVVPGALADTQEIMHWIAAELGPRSYVNVMAQYRPAGQVGRNPRYEAINRPIHPEEYAAAVRAAIAAGLFRLGQRVPQRLKHSVPRSPWAFRRE